MMWVFIIAAGDQKVLILDATYKVVIRCGYEVS